MGGFELSADDWAKVGAASGIIFVLALVAIWIFGPGLDPPGFKSGEIVGYVDDNKNKIQAATALSTLAGFAFLLFLGSIVLALRSAEGAPGRLSAAAAAGGIAFIALAGIGVVAEQTAALQQLSGGTGNGDITRAFHDAGVTAFALSGLGFAALAWSAGVLTQRAGALPALLGAFSAAAGLYVLVVSIFGAFQQTGAFSPYDGLLGLISLLVIVVWVGVIAIALIVNPVYARARGRR
jgi:hypothetical protein